jgi:signal transduction histidine kinase/CheY-like chemotaxis protein
MSPDWKFMHQLDGRGFLKTTTGTDEFHIEEYAYPDDLALARAAIADAIANKTIFALEHRVLRVDGSHGWTYSRAVPILDDDGAILEWIGMASDITVRKRIEEQLTEASNRKDEFLAMLAHELRNPLAPVKAAAQLLQLRPLNEERVLHTSQIIARQVAHMTNLVDELLDVSRVSKNLIKLDRAALDMRDVIGDAVEQVAPLIQSLHHCLDIASCQYPIHVDGDEKRLVQILANLLSNAAKYTPPGGTIRVACHVAGDEAVVEVIDNGIGMTPETLHVAFDLFSQAERSSDRASGGLGLGLALVKSLAGLHGGRVDCASAGLGKGSTFTVRLPLLRVAGRLDAPAPERSSAPAPAPSLRILVVDDNEDAAATLAMLLEAMGHEVAVEHTPAAALAHAAIAPPQVCLLDIGLPGMDGNELAQRLRARPETAHAVLMAVTGYGQESDRTRSMAAGFDFHLVKPVDIGKLGQLLSKAAH